MRSSSWVLGLLLLLAPLPSSAGDGAVALQTADRSCADDSVKRYVDCGNGTVTDNDTGLVWLKNAACLASCSNNLNHCTSDADCPGSQTCVLKGVDWRTAMDFAAGLSDQPDTVFGVQDCGLSDGSSPGEWRLPTVGEWEAMVAHARDVLGCTSPTISNDLGTGCWTELCRGCSFFNLPTNSVVFWTSHTMASSPDAAFWGTLGNGDTGIFLKSFSAGLVWPVRGGQ